MVYLSDSFWGGVNKRLTPLIGDIAAKYSEVVKSNARKALGSALVAGRPVDVEAELREKAEWIKWGWIEDLETLFPDSAMLTALKLKFWESATCIAGEMNGAKRSVAIHLIGEQGQLVQVGNVTVPANAALPAKDDLIEIRYLYRAGANGSLFQPTYLGRRTDLDRSEARIEQIRRIKQNQAANDWDDSIAA